MFFYVVSRNIKTFAAKLYTKEENVFAVNDHEYDYSVGTLYVDIINELEKLGDYVVNVVEARFGK